MNHTPDSWDDDSPAGSGTGSPFHRWISFEDRFRGLEPLGVNDAFYSPNAHFSINLKSPLPLVSLLFFPLLFYLLLFYLLLFLLSSFSFLFFFFTTSFWAADPKGTMSYRTEVRPVPPGSSLPPP